MYLDTIAVRRDFEVILKNVLRSVEFWKEETFFEVDAQHDEDLYTIDAHKVCITLHFDISRPIDGVNIFHKISVDIVPTIEIPNYWPEEAILDVSEDLKSGGVHLLFYEPRRLYPWLSNSSIPYARVSFC